MRQIGGNTIHTPQPIELSYGRQAPTWRRRKVVLVALLVVGTATAAWIAGPHALRWYQVREALGENHRWYAAAVNWREPAAKLKYTEHPEDLPSGRSGRSYGTPPIRFRSFGGSSIERLPRFDRTGLPILATDFKEVWLFAHQRTAPTGQSRLIVVSSPYFSGNLLELQVDQVGLHDGLYRPLRAGVEKVDLAGVCGPREIRLFAGQPDPHDPSRFSIPFEARGRRGFIDGTFEPGPSFSSDRASAKVEAEANSTVRLTVRMESATRPAP